MGIETVFAEGAKRSKLHRRGHGRLGEGFTICGMKVEEAYKPLKDDGGIPCKICSRPRNPPPNVTPEQIARPSTFDPSNKMLSELVAIKLAIHDLVDEMRLARGVKVKED